MNTIPRRTYLKLLQPTEKKIRDSLIFETNISIGHFAVSNSHIRTHYDLYSFLQRDDVFEYLHALIYNMVDKSERILIIGLGLEHDALNYLVGQFRNYNVDIVESIACLTPTYSKHQDDEYELRISALLKEGDCDCILIVSDIVNTGETLKRLVEVIEKQLAHSVPIKLCTIVKMKNTQDTIMDGYSLTAGVTINRDYYPADDTEKCLLCHIKQPLTKVAAVEDFHVVDKLQLTSYDFWEIVTDSKALKKMSIDSLGRKLIYSIDTEFIVKRYRNWLKKIISYKYNMLRPNSRPNCILTVQDPVSLPFTEAAAEALNIKNIISVSRSDLSVITESSPLKNSPFNNGIYRIIIVDEGINYGDTMRNLINYCRAGSQIPFAAIVFYNRLTKEHTKKLESRMSGAKILSLYDWNSAPLTYS